MLASFVAVSGMASNASRRVVGQWGGAGGAICEDHFDLARAFRGFARRLVAGDTQNVPHVGTRASTAPLFLRAFPEMTDGHETCATVSYPPMLVLPCYYNWHSQASSSIRRA